MASFNGEVFLSKRHCIVAVHDKNPYRGGTPFSKSAMQGVGAEKCPGHFSTRWLTIQLGIYSKLILPIVRISSISQ
jgi:hypothetical protein